MHKEAVELDTCAAVSSEDLASEEEGEASKDWADLPPELLEAIGSSLSSTSQAANASIVCKTWRSNMTQGMPSLELDMHPDPQRWSRRLARLSHAMRSLRIATLHVPPALPPSMLATHLGQLQGVLPGLQELHLRLSDSMELGCDAAGALGDVGRGLTAISIVGGTLAHGAALRLLSCLGSTQQPTLQRLCILPAAVAGMGRASGLGDDECAALANCQGLKELEFRAYRLTSAGFVHLSALQQVQRLAISSLESDMGYEMSCLVRMAALTTLELALDSGGGGGGGAGGRAGPLGPLIPLAAAREDAQLALHFRWTDRAAGLLRACASHLAGRLTSLDMGSCRLSTSEVWDALGHLTHLRQLGMSVYNNSDTHLLCELAALSRLATLHSLSLTKQRAYFPEHRRFRASNIAVPVTAEGMSVLASSWAGSLQELRLALTRTDFTRDGLAALSSLTALTSLALLVEAGDTSLAHTPPMCTTSEPPSLGTSPIAAVLVGRSAGSMSAVNAPLVVDLGCVPQGLKNLEVAGVVVEVPPCWGGAMGGAGSGPGCSMPVPALPPGMLPSLQSLSLDACHLSHKNMAALAGHVAGTLERLALVGVGGVSDRSLPHLSSLRLLTSLVVLAQANPAVSQASLAALSSLTGLKHLAWESHDLTNCGPVLSAYTAFAGLRLLSLSCTQRTLAAAVPGGMAVFEAHLPYCCVDVVGGDGQAGWGVQVEEEQEQ